jgi:hypothetical protein
MLTNVEQMYFTDEHMCNRTKVSIKHAVNSEDRTAWSRLLKNSVTQLWLLNRFHINACKTNRKIPGKI